MAKLTLNVDSRVVLGAKRYAKFRGISISQMVETYLDTVAKQLVPAKSSAPILRSVRGLIRNADVDDYRKYLDKKYR